MKLFTFLMISMSFLISVLFFNSTLYYLGKREQTSKIIINNLNNSLTELTFIIEKTMSVDDKIHDFKIIKPILNRNVATNNFITSISIFENKKFVVGSSNKFNRKPLKTLQVGSTTIENYYDIIKKFNSISYHIILYYGFNGKKYDIVLFINTEYIDTLFSNNFSSYFYLHLLFPMILLIVFGVLVMKFILNPLNKLNSFALYQENIPSQFKLTELEKIRYTLKNSFNNLKSEKQELYNLVRTDMLTGIYNRSGLEEYVNKKINSNNPNKEFAFVFLDLDNFKLVNDSLGHNFGDKIIKKVAKTIESELDKNDIVSRIGGDEFIVILSDYGERNDLIRKVQVIKDRIKETTYQIYYSVISASVGIVLYPADADNLSDLMKFADMALFKSKELGKAQYTFYTNELFIETQNMINLTHDLEFALEHNEFELYYQPQNDTYSHKIIGVEALIRWNHPKKGLILPGEFIPLAEQSDFIINLGLWIFEEAIKQKEKWEKLGIDIKISINVAIKQLLSKNFLENTEKIINRYDININNIVIELTEYTLINQFEETYELLKSLQNMGIKISLDDFGTGYSSLAYIKKFPINSIKIDKSFMDDYETEEGAIFIETIIKLVKTLKMDIIAEGVETKDQLEFLRTAECDFFQGYLISKPLPIIDIEKLLNICSTQSCDECTEFCQKLK